MVRQVQQMNEEDKVGKDVNNQGRNVTDSEHWNLEDQHALTFQ